MNCFHEDKRLYTKEEFIKQIKTDETFAKQWGELGPIYVTVITTDLEL
jgi:hypothetical protein